MAKRRFVLSSDDLGKDGSSRNQSIPVICQQIRFYREKQGMEQKALAQQLNITGNSVSNWENGRARPDVNLLPAVCRALGISLYDLFALDHPDTSLTEHQRQLLQKYDTLTPGHQYAVDRLVDALADTEKTEWCPELRVLLRFNRSLAAGVGDPTELEDDAEPVYVYAEPDIGNADSIFKVNGDSMEPDFHDGQDVLVRRMKGNRELSFGEIGAFIIGNEMYIKQYEPDGLHSLNPDYPVMRFEDEMSVFLIGRVLGVFDPAWYANAEDVEKYKLLHPEV